MKKLGLCCMTFVSCLFALTWSAPARACGGCFHAENAAPSVVVGHRMALSISQERTVLWDQVTYSGAPEDFAWVLPVGKGAYLEVAHEAWFEALQAVTGTRVVSRRIVCGDGVAVRQDGGSVSGCIGGTMSASDRGSNVSDADGSRRQGGVDGVTVLHESAVGPYQTVTLSADDALSMRQWLTSHSYLIPEEIDPVLDSYIAQGADFIALRLAPAYGVRHMAPVRVITPGASPVLPLRMVAAGTGAKTSIVLYLIGEGRYQASNFPSSLVATHELVWDWSSGSSNYSPLREEAVLNNAFLTSFARPGAFYQEVPTTEGTPAEYRVDGALYERLSDVYLAQAGESAAGCDLNAKLASSQVVVDTCDADGICVDAPTGSQAMVDLACGEADDIAAALVGLHPKDVWVTRLDADLSRTAFADDLVLEAANTQTVVANWHEAPNDLALPCTLAGESSELPVVNDPDDRDSSRFGCSCRASPLAASPLAGTSVIGLVLLWLRRRRRKT